MAGGDWRQALSRVAEVGVEHGIGAFGLEGREPDRGTGVCLDEVLELLVVGEGDGGHDDALPARGLGLVAIYVLRVNGVGGWQGSFRKLGGGTGGEGRRAVGYGAFAHGARR